MVDSDNFHYRTMYVFKLFIDFIISYKLQLTSYNQRAKLLLLAISTIQPLL